MTKERPRNIANDILDCVESATAKRTKQKKSEERHPGNVRYRASRMTREPRTTQKEAAWEVLEAAYMAASGNGRLPALARQIFYQARPKIMALTDDKAIGRTPEYLGKKISTREMQFALFALLLSPALILVSAGVSSVLKIALDSLGVGGPHGLSEIVYAYASSAADNGSSFAGLNANTLWYNITTGLAMFFGRFAHAIPILAIAGSLAAKKKAKPSAGTMPTDGPLFIGFLLSVVAIVTLLQYLPALALGPIAEHFLISQGSTF